ncbi:hormogonium polysaccharide biosynthesis protein HpsA [Dolichospermum circinale]|uniref:hormogonium polysaccharide biosynthesis protein HpsA n=1 Tax=Dolichospermum circinale TaxID=109265 RepID=UPI00232DA89C|nr:hormogonium polysaccharide biosynthesis protein HpsA [Dolichospermum circinale]MDB9453551.1 hormogonium polysaccharide biosynthesis protein HpsA [Dolichospermum circinale CS-541/06]MDB9462937.1 hormogonium polysaccharide biosynthesis protein HpsA [Dolichospermum circinale CS-541/04]MDB9546599.1 hormogonium polysaccharide biosynthesis protein HpsA [Dolichospermum circinale CS-1031]
MYQKNQQLKKVIRILTKFLRGFFIKKATKRSLNWLLRNVFRTQKKQKLTNAGFVLPTVLMVSLVVVLLTTAIMVRSFNRRENANNVRVNESVMTAATPAIDRGKAKISKLLQDKTLPKTTPTDDDLYNALVNNIDKYTFGDETKLTLSLQGQPSLETAWRFPLDTDSNGKFDSYTLYGIYFKTPPVVNGQYSRARNALEARNVPIVKGTLNANCGSIDTSLVGNTGWVRQDNEIKKAFFVYTAIARITNPPNTTNYEVYNGKIAGSLGGAVEYQQDRVQTPTNNNAVVYDDDLELNSSTNLNGGVFTNSNLLAAGSVSNLRLYQVSSQASCFYKPKNAKIIVGGNLALGKFTDESDTGGATVDLYNGKIDNVATGTLTKSVTNSPKDTAYNNLAYVRRINKLIDAQIAADSTGANDPTEVKNGFALKQTALGITFDDTERLKYRRQQLEIYFKRRTRRVPYTEVAFGAIEIYPNPLLQGSADTLRPIDSWVYPTDPTDGKTGVNYTNLSLNISGTSLEPKSSDPKELKKNSGKEKLLGDRVLVSNNLPELRWDTSKNQFIGSYIEDTQDISGIKWDLPSGTTQTRTRPSLVRNLADIGSNERDGDWELAAAKVPTSTTDPVGGLRVVTGAGVYLSKDDTPGSITSTDKEILSDIEGMYDDTKPYLKMRATAVYHYKSTGYNAQTPKPIACVSSYYDPTDNKSYKNMDSLPNASNLEKDKDGKSNRGIVYPAPTKTVSDYATALTYLSQLKYNNRPLIDDGLLARALNKAAANRTISEQSAIDAQICALQILDGSLSPNDSVIPHGAIFETFFSDQRENKKVRATVLDLNLLRTKPIGGSEYLLPNSGIIYATRDDALPDISAGNTDAGKLESPVDYSDDTTRRPSAIILINGEKLWRTNSYKEEEKGLTLATNLPAYIKGDFNLHTQEEFTNTLADDWSNFYTRSTFNNNFACRSGDSRFPNCTTGDEWRPANILADAVTLLSGDFDFTKELGYTIGSQQTAKNDTTFNLIIAAGDNPAQPTVDNGGLNNLVRVIENWTSSKIKLNGAFMQVKKSAYATGTNPPQTVNNPPTRQWSYDVGLLFQSPDLFASKLAVTPPEPPDEYLREVGRDDTWVQTLLCAKETSTPNFAIEDPKQRPDICQ